MCGDVTTHVHVSTDTRRPRRAREAAAAGAGRRRGRRCFGFGSSGVGVSSARPRSRPASPPPPPPGRPHRASVESRPMGMAGSPRPPPRCRRVAVPVRCRMCPQWRRGRAPMRHPCATRHATPSLGPAGAARLRISRFVYAHMPHPPPVSRRRHGGRRSVGGVALCAVSPRMSTTRQRATVATGARGT